MLKTSWDLGKVRSGRAAAGCVEASEQGASPRARQGEDE